MRTAFSLLLLVPAVLAGTARDASKSFEEGRYREALALYARLAEETPEDPRPAFNAGVSAYRAGDMEEAVARFDAAARSPDLPLQQQAHYNKGNALYRAGEALQDPRATIGHWERALRAYDNALALNTTDALARENREFVRQRLDELRRQQEQENQQENQENQEDQGDQQEEQPQDQEGEQQPRDEQDQEGQQQPREEQPQDREGEQQPRDEQDQEGRQPPPQDGNEEQEASDEEPRQGAMTREEALQLLDSRKDQGGMMLFSPTPASARPPQKDW